MRLNDIVKVIYLYPPRMIPSIYYENWLLFIALKKLQDRNLFFPVIDWSTPFAILLADILMYIFNNLVNFSFLKINLSIGLQKDVNINFKDKMLFWWFMLILKVTIIAGKRCIFSAIFSMIHQKSILLFK